MENSKIEWTHATFNPWMGCTKVSPGCVNCYAETLMDTRYGRVSWGKGQPRVRTSHAYWKQPLKWNKETNGERKRVFCASLSDVFDEEVSDEWRNELFDLINTTRNLDWLILTKRPAKARSYLKFLYGRCRDGVPLPNVWIGTSVEDQKRAQERIPILVQIPAKIRFLSVEPMLEPVDFLEVDALANQPWPALHWVICGGESGQGKRPFKAEWARNLRDQCKSSDVAFFMKQMDKVQPIPDDLMIRQFPNDSSPPNTTQSLPG